MAFFRISSFRLLSNDILHLGRLFPGLPRKNPANRWRFQPLYKPSIAALECSPHPQQSSLLPTATPTTSNSLSLVPSRIALLAMPSVAEAKAFDVVSDAVDEGTTLI